MITYPTTEDLTKTRPPSHHAITPNASPQSAGFRFTADRWTRYTLDAGYAVPTPLQGFPGAHTPTIYLDADGTLALSAGYRWDGASGPAPDWDHTMRASAVHDALTLLIDLGILPASKQAQADRLYATHAREDGAPISLALVYYAALRLYDRHNPFRRAARKAARRAYQHHVSRLAPEETPRHD